MPKSQANKWVWLAGFHSGVLAALAVVEAAEGAFSTTYKEIVAACGLRDLITAARREKDPQLKHLRKLQREG